MAAVGGSIQSMSIRGRLFAVASDADSNKKLGGYENEVAPNGNGTARLIKTAVAWSLDGINVEIDENRADQEFLQEIADGNEFVDVAVTYASGVTYQGTGQIVGEVAVSSQSATCPLAFQGQGTMTQQ